MRSRLLIFFLCSLLTAGCSRYTKLVKSGDFAKKEAAAHKYYAKKDYYRAQTLFEQLQDHYSGTEKSEEMLFFNAYSNYGLRNFTIGGYLFKTYTENFPSGKHTEECYFMYAYCLMKDTYPYELDQTNTYKAIEEFKLFTNIFPDSKYIPDCNNHIDELRGKLSYKAYRNAKMYYRISDYKGAIVTMGNALRDFPEMNQKEELEFLMLKSAYLYAKNSIEEKKKERFQESLISYQSFVEGYPQSKYRKEADYIYQQLQLQLRRYGS